MLWIHIAAGLAAIVFGFVALHARKGRPVHVAAGRVFVIAMATMTVSAVSIAAFVNANPGNILAGSMTFYLVATGWLAVRPDPPRLAHVALAALGFGAGAYGLFIASVAYQAPGRVIAGIPAVVTLVFGVVVLLAASGDLRLLRRGRIVGPARLLRHLWRMGFALWIATASFFLGQADEFPAAVRDSGVLAVPVLVVTGTFLFWGVRQSWRVVRSPRRSAAARAASGLSAAG
jgi:uncharacterized membrane protein